MFLRKPEFSTVREVGPFTSRDQQIAVTVATPQDVYGSNSEQGLHPNQAWSSVSKVRVSEVLILHLCDC